MELISQEIIFTITVNYLIVTPLWILCVTIPTTCIKPERTQLITNKLFAKKLFLYLKFTHVLLIYIYSTLFTAIFVIYITFKWCYLSRTNNPRSNYFRRLKYTP